MKKTGAQIIIELLERHGIDTIAGIPGGMNLPMYDALYHRPIRHILARHEQGAGFIAQGMARSTGKPAVCFATSGPGVTNLLTALADAKLDSIPVIAITGQVPLPLRGSDAFQEVDTVGLSQSITKHSFLAHSAAELLEIIPEAFRIAASGRPGPVLIDIPKDVQQQTLDLDHWPECGTPLRPLNAGDREIGEAVALIKNAKRPLLYAGGGVIHSEASPMLQEIARRNGIPVVATLMGLGCMRHNDPLFLGMLGMHGSAHTNRTVNSCDLLIACGVRFDDRATGKIGHFCPDARIVHIDIDQSEHNKIRRADVAIAGDIGEALREIGIRLKDDRRTPWAERAIPKAIENSPMGNGFPEEDRASPTALIRSIGTLADPDALITTDVGQHQMWVAQSYPFMKPRTLLTSGGLGTMGFGLPAAIGAALAHPGREVLCFTGDGSLLMNIQELATLAEHDLNVKVLLFNNEQLGLVRQQQDLFYRRNLMASRFARNPDFVAISKGFGIRGIDWGRANGASLSQALGEKGPLLINFPIHPELQVLPMVPPGGSNLQMIGA